MFLEIKRSVDFDLHLDKVRFFFWLGFSLGKVVAASFSLAVLVHLYELQHLKTLQMQNRASNKPETQILSRLWCLTEKQLCSACTPTSRCFSQKNKLGNRLWAAARGSTVCTHDCGVSFHGRS